VEDRVWLEKLKDEKLPPNLYIFLVGPGSLGKGTAIGRAMKLLKVTESGLISTFRGKTTAAHLLDRMGKKMIDEVTGVAYIPNPKIWLVMDELANDVGRGGMAEDFITMMTELYTGHYDFDTGTRTNGYVKIEQACINWLAGSTQEWLMKTFTPETILSGFTARGIYVFADYNDDVRYRRPLYPHDYNEVMEHLKARLLALQYTNGEFIFTEGASAWEEQWYMNRRRPEDENLWAAWKRGHDMILKLAMIFSLADGGPLVITYNHIYRAVQAYTEVQNNMARLVELSDKTPEVSDTMLVEKVLRVKKKISHTNLMRALYKKGITKRRLDPAIANLKNRGLVHTEFQGSHSIVYVWNALEDELAFVAKTKKAPLKAVKEEGKDDQNRAVS
jgi:hypothetical protein